MFCHFWVIGCIFKGSDIELFSNNLKNINVYFHDIEKIEVENSLDTYIFTVENKNIKVGRSLSVSFHNPVLFQNYLYEVFPNVNITNLPKDEYLMQLYYYFVKLIARTRGKRVKNKKEKGFFYEDFFYGINSKRIIVRGNEIEKIIPNELELLNDMFCITIAQILYENIENKPYTVSLDCVSEVMLKKFKFYLSKAYYSPCTFVKDYLRCDVKRINNQICNKLNFEGLVEFENAIK